MQFLGPPVGGPSFSQPPLVFAPKLQAPGLAPPQPLQVGLFNAPPSPWPSQGQPLAAGAGFRSRSMTPTPFVNYPRFQQIAVPASGSNSTPGEVANRSVDPTPWIRAASNFALNSDFNISIALQHQQNLDLAGVMAIMKEESKGKRTIQALADKLVLHKMLANMDVPQMPRLLTIEGQVHRCDIARFIDEHLSKPGSSDVVVKPTHLSNGAGVLILKTVPAEQRQHTIQYLTEHIRHHMQQHAGAHESLALQSLKPAFIIQPRYQSVVHFDTPLEIRIVALWGKVRLGLWWWGRQIALGESPHRNAWIIRRPRRQGKLSTNDHWEVVHEHTGTNPGFDSALELFERHMPAMAATAEAISVAVGAPFLRCDFFVGSAEWGVRLNEVAYGCGVDYRSRSEDGTGSIVDDAPSIARILHEGMARCKVVLPAKSFLVKLGAQGRNYHDMAVAPLPRSLFDFWQRSPASTERAGKDKDAEEYAVPQDLCKTIKPTTKTGCVAPPCGLGLSQPPSYPPQYLVPSSQLMPSILGGMLLGPVPQFQFLGAGLRVPAR